MATVYSGVNISSNAAIGLPGTCGQILCGGGAVSMSGSAILHSIRGSHFINNRQYLDWFCDVNFVSGDFYFVRKS